MIEKYNDEKLSSISVILLIVALCTPVLWFSRSLFPVQLWEILMGGLFIAFCFLCIILRNIVIKLIQFRKKKFYNTENKFLPIYESKLLGIIISDFNGNVRHANNAFLNMIGYSKKDLEKGLISWKQITPPEFTEISEKCVEELRKSGECTTFEKQYFRKDGSRIWVLIGASALRNDPDGDAVTYIIDITSKKEASLKAVRLESIIKEKETEFFKTLADETPFMVWKFNEEGKCEYVNKRWTQFTGLSYEESLGFGFEKAMKIDSTDPRTQRWLKSIESRQPYEIKFRLKKADGTLRWVMAQAKPYYIKQDFKGYVGSIVDITDQELAIQAIKELSQKKDEFLSIASHELKTPLTTIKAFIQLAERNLEKNHGAFQYISKVSGNLSRLERLIADLLDVSKINAGKLSYNESEFDFNEVLEDSVTTMQLTSKNHQLILNTAGSVIFKGDKYRIEQLIYNFISNAIKYSPEGKKVIITSEVKENNIVVSFQDFGIGIAKEELAHIFDRYYRVDNTAMKFEGLGLGLFISSEILKRSHGSMWIESEIGKGSTFYFLLPLSAEQVLKEPETDHQTWYSSNKLDIRYVPEKNWMDVNWKGFQNFETVKAGCLTLLELIQKNRCSKVLNDNTHVLGNWSDASEWGAKEWFPMMEKAGLRHFAWIYSPSTFSKMAAEKSTDIQMGNIVFQFFTTKEEAASWLSSVAD